MIDGTFVPVLIGNRSRKSFVNQIGEDGLTCAILFNRARAPASGLRWVRRHNWHDAR